MYECPNLPPPAPPLLSWAQKPPVMSVAMICSDSLSHDDRPLWKQVCTRAIQVLTSIPEIPRDTNWKGHPPVLSACGTIVYCALCHATRKKKNQFYLASKPCQHEKERLLCEGDYRIHRGHCMRFSFKKWKASSSRPASFCVKCGEWSWLPGSLASECRLT